VYRLATVNFEINDIKRHFGVEEFEKLVDSMGMDISGRSDDTVTVDITPNRPDLLDFFGLVRALKYIKGEAKPEERYKLTNEPAVTIKVDSSVSKVRPYIASIVAKSISLTDSSLRYLINLTDKLGDTYGRDRSKLAIGIHNLNAIKGSLEYGASKNESFVPLGSDKKMSFEEIIKGHKKGVEYSHTVERGRGKTVYPFLKDSEKILSMIPIINSEATKVTTSTKSLLIDVTGIDIKTVEAVTNLLACTLMDMDSDIYPVIIDYKNGKRTTPMLGYREIKITPNSVSRTIGAEIPRIRELANKAGYVVDGSEGTLVVKVPPYRIDVFNEQDVIEDIAIAYGYNNIRPEPVLHGRHGVQNSVSARVNTVSIFMLGLGFFEALNTYLSNEEIQFKNMNMPEQKNVIKLLHSKTESYTVLRQSMVPSLLQNLSSTTHEKMPQRLFEIGGVFAIDGNPKESINLAFVSEHSKANISEAKSYVEAVLDYLKLDYQIEEGVNGSFIDGRYAVIKVKGRVIGHFGELHPDVLTNFRLEEPVVCAELKIINNMPYLI